MHTLVDTVIRESVYKELEKLGVDPINFQVSIFEQEGMYTTFHGRIFHLGSFEPEEVGSYSVLVIPGEEFPEAGEAQLKLSVNEINNNEVKL